MVESGQDPSSSWQRRTRSAPEAVLTGPFQSIHDAAPAAGGDEQLKNLAFLVGRLEVLPATGKDRVPWHVAGALTSPVSGAGLQVQPNVLPFSGAPAFGASAAMAG